MKRILIIGSAEQFESTRQPAEDLRIFAQQAAAETAMVSYVSLDHLVHVLDGKSLQVYIAETGEDIAAFDFIWLRGRFVPTMNDIALVGEYLERKAANYANESYAYRGPYGKLAQMHALAAIGLPYPKTVHATGERAAGAFTKHLSFPMIVKNNHGGHGDKNYLVADRQSLERILKDDADTAFVAQEFIPNDADYRILVAGGKQLIIKRQGSPNSHLNNTSKGAIATLVPEADFPADVLAEARTFAHAMHYEISGVDVMFSSETGTHYFLEANSQPQIISGAFIDKKNALLAEYLKEKLAS